MQRYHGHAQHDGTALFIGAIHNTSGQQHVLDVPSATGARLAVNQLNSGGGILQGYFRAQFEYLGGAVILSTP